MAYLDKGATLGLLAIAITVLLLIGAGIGSLITWLVMR